MTRPSVREQKNVPAMLRLAQGLHCRIVTGTPIFLDAANGRYFLLRGETAARFLAFAEGKASPDDLQALIDLHLLDQQDRPGEPPVCAPIAAASSYDSAPPRVPNRLVIEAIVRQWLAILAIKRQTLASILARLAAAKTQQRRRSTSIAGRDESVIAAAFRRAQRFIPATNQCLPRSLALAAMLRGHGHDPIVIIGVRLPFAAHCWVQCEDRVLSDPLDRAHAFEPILAI